MFKKIQERTETISKKLAWLAPLLARIAVGVVFAQTGWGKLNSLGNVTEFFTTLGIPAPGFHAALVATTELVGGILILVGLAARFAALPLSFTMIVAILTAKRSEIEGIGSLLGFEETLYFVLFVWIAIAGAGAASIDHLIARKRSIEPLLRPSPEAN